MSKGNKKPTVLSDEKKVEIKQELLNKKNNNRLVVKENLSFKYEIKR